MKITRPLKYGGWEWDDETQELTASVWDEVDDEGNPIGKAEKIRIKKTYVYSLNRFMIRIFQRLGRKRRK